MEVPPLFTRIAHLLSCLLVVSGFAMLIAQTPGTPYVFEVAGPQERLGTDLVFVGDINGNGSDDVVIGSPGGLGPAGPLGRLRAVDGRTVQQIWTVTGGVLMGYLGQSLATTPDLDGDGIVDLVTSERGPGQSAPIISWFSGASGAPLGQQTLTGWFSGSRVATVIPWRDWNGDGVSDYAVSGVNDLMNQPFVAIVDRLTGVLTTAPLSTTQVFLQGNILSNHMLGDVDLTGDGIDDLVVGDPMRSTSSGLLARGVVEVLDGLTLQVVWAAQGTQIYGGLGASLISAPDLDADGVREIVAGQPGDVLPVFTTPGRFRVLSGANGGTLFDLISPTTNVASLGSAIVREGPINPLGTEIFIAAARPVNLSPAPGTSGPVLFRYLLGPIAIQTAGVESRDLDAAFVPNNARPALAGNGDLNGDGVVDVALGIDGGILRSSVHLFPTRTSVPFSAPNPVNQTLSLYTNAAAGQPNFTYSLTSSPGLPGTPYVAVAGLQTAVIPVLATNLLIDVTAPFVLMPGTFGMFGTDTIDFAAPGSVVPLISSLSFYLQAFSFDPMAPQGLVSSNAVQVTF